MIPEIQAEKQNTKQNQLAHNANITKTYVKFRTEFEN